MSGHVAGRYRIISELGSGGMGLVYRARDERLGRDVAIKVLPEQALADPRRRQRFEREARAAAAIDHPNVLAVFDIGEDGGRPFIVTELLEGETLRARIGRGDIGPGRAVELGIQIARGLTVAHDRGIVHRDLKPENVIVTAEGTAKVVDFGLARLVDPVPDDDVEDVMASATPTGDIITQSGAVLGTAAYMSPEQARGETVHAASDIFSFGCVLYEMLTGRRPFAGASASEQIAAILRDEPRRMEETRIPPAVAAVVRRCLEKSPVERYTSGRELALALEVAATDATGEGSAPPRRARSLWTAASLALVGGLVAAAIVLRPGPPPSPAIQSVAVLPFDDLSAEPGRSYFADGMTEALIASLARDTSLTVISKTSCMLFRESELTLPEIARRLGADAVVEGSVVRAGDRVRITAQLIDGRSDRHLWTDSYDRKLADVLALHAEAARAIAAEVGAALQPAAVDAAGVRRVDPRAYDLYLRGRELSASMKRIDYLHAVDHYRRALAIEPDLAEAWASLALDTLFLFQLNEYSYEECLAVVEEAAERAMAAGPDRADAHFAMASLHLLRWEWSDHERETRRTLVLNPSHSRAWVILGQWLTLTGDHAGARKAFSRAVELNPLDVWTTACAMANDPDGSVDELLARCAEVERLDPEGYLPHWIRAGILVRGKRYDEAITEYRRTLGLQPRFGTVQADLAAALAADDRSSEAREILAELERDVARGRAFASDLATVHFALGDADSAYAALAEGVRARDIYMHWALVPLAATGDPRALELVRAIGLQVPDLSGAG